MRWAPALALGLVLAVLPVPPGASQEATYEPHVIVAVPDTGINPYHELFYRPALTDHPCTYIEDFPCDVVELPLTVGTGLTYAEALDADAELWADVEPDRWYWIPKTSFVAVMCEPVDERGALNSPPSTQCILDDGERAGTVMGGGTSHGTATTSSVITENPDALLAFAQGGPDHQRFLDQGLPVDVFSVSWGSALPIPLPRAPGTEAIYVKSAGNTPRPTTLSGWAGHPSILSVGGAYSGGDDDQPTDQHGEDALAAKQPDLVGPFCRTTADVRSIQGSRDTCGTSFAGPTAAGGISLAILELRRASGYTGGIEGGLVDGELGITMAEFRDAINRTATYDPDPRWDPGIAPIPLNPVAPWLQWGWGWYDGDTARAAVEHLLGTASAPPKPEAARVYMEATHAATQAAYGTDPLQEVEDLLFPPQPANRPPTARIDVECDGLTCTLNGSASTDPDGQPIDYAWDLGDGTTATTPIVEHTYPTGRRNVTLTVSDGALTDEETVEVLTLPEAELTVATDQASYGLDDEVTVTATLTDKTTGEGIEGMPIEIKTQWQAPGPNAIHRSRTYLVMELAGVGHHEATVTTGPDGRATWTVPSDLAEQAERFNLPTGLDEVDVDADLEQTSIRLHDTTGYTVEGL